MQFLIFILPLIFFIFGAIGAYNAYRTHIASLKDSEVFQSRQAFTTLLATAFTSVIYGILVFLFPLLGLNENPVNNDLIFVIGGVLFALSVFLKLRVVLSTFSSDKAIDEIVLRNALLKSTILEIIAILPLAYIIYIMFI